MTTIAQAVDNADTVPPHSQSRDTFRIPLDWARVEPADGSYDEAVFDRYVDGCENARRRDAEPVIVLHHSRPPGWLGPDFWLRLDAPERFGSWAAAAVQRLGAYCGQVVTLVEPNAVAWRTWLTGALPPRRVGAVGDLVRGLDHMLAAHVVAQASVHLARPDAVADLEIRPLPVYELDGMLNDVLAARDHGVGRYDLRRWLTERRRDWYQKRRPLALAGGLVRRAARSAIPLEQALPRTVAAVYDGNRRTPDRSLRQAR
ncbi:MAG: family 1 glycosylhydrolase [Actinomycetota bacterium]|nr:family 1 glycosylhydrolase [Actinomycetota bacterium]